VFKGGGGLFRGGGGEEGPGGRIFWKKFVSLGLVQSTKAVRDMKGGGSCQVERSYVAMGCMVGAVRTDQRKIRERRENVNGCDGAKKKILQKRG